jgi:Predicted membrane protein (DUF2232)
VSRLKPTGAAGGCGGSSAVLYLSVLTGSLGATILVSLAQLPLFIAGLWLGTAAAAVAGLTAVAIVLVAARDLMTAALFAGLYATPVVVLVWRALLARSRGDGTVEWYPPGQLTEWLTGFALGAFGIAVLWLGGAQAVRSILRQELAPALAAIDTTAANRAMLIDTLAEIVPGVLAASWMIMVAGNGVLAEGVLIRFGANWRPSPRLAELSLPIWITALLAAAIAAAMLGGQASFLGINVLIVLSVPYSLAGLAVVHVAASRLARPAVPLVTFYVLAGLFGWPLLLVALLGLLDGPLSLRRRLALPQSFGGN